MNGAVVRQRSRFHVVDRVGGVVAAIGAHRPSLIQTQAGFAARVVTPAVVARRTRRRRHFRVVAVRRRTLRRLVDRACQRHRLATAKAASHPGAGRRRLRRQRLPFDGGRDARPRERRRRAGSTVDVRRAGGSFRWARRRRRRRLGYGRDTISVAARSMDRGRRRRGIGTIWQEHLGNGVTVLPAEKCPTDRRVVVVKHLVIKIHQQTFIARRILDSLVLVFALSTNATTHHEQPVFSVKIISTQIHNDERSL